MPYIDEALLDDLDELTDLLDGPPTVLFGNRRVLAKLRAAVVNARALAGVGTTVG